VGCIPNVKDDKLPTEGQCISTHWTTVSVSVILMNTMETHFHFKGQLRRKMNL